MIEEQRKWNVVNIILFNRWCWNNQTPTCKRINLDTDLALITKINSKCIAALSVKHTTINLLEDNIEENLEDLGCGNTFKNMTWKT